MPLRVWVDAQLPPALARWLAEEHGVEAAHVEDLGLLRAADPAIFDAARAADVVVVTKDTDFVQTPARFLQYTDSSTSEGRRRECRGRRAAT